MHIHQHLHTPLVDLLDCSVPILSAGMGGVARFELAAAVSNAGGVGCLGMVRETPDFIEQQVRLLWQRTREPFAVNIIPYATDPVLLAQQIDCLINLKIPIVCLFWEVNPTVVERFKQSNILVMHQVGSVNDAQLALDAGVDVLIAQGFEAGGHVRGLEPLATLLPALCVLSPIPVVAAGGIGSGKSMVKAMNLGAQGVWCGSAFLTTHEANAHNYHKKRLVAACRNDTVYTKKFSINWPDNAPVRVLKNSVTEIDVSSLTEPTIIGQQDGKPVYLYSTDSPLQGAEGDLEKMTLYAGYSCDEITTICSAADRVQQFVEEANKEISQSVPSSRNSINDSVTAYASSPCLLNETDPSYHGYLNEIEILSLLFTLLKAERAGAKICAASLKQASFGDWREKLLRIHRDESRTCHALIESIHYMGAKPPTEIGDFFETCMSIADLDERMRLLNHGQAWVVKKIDGALAKIADPVVSGKLKSMRDEHQQNIDYLNNIFAAEVSDEQRE